MGQFVGTNKEEMIQSRQNLKYYLLEDLKRFNNNKPNLKDRILHNEVWYTLIPQHFDLTLFISS